MRAAGKKVAWVVGYGGEEVEGGVKGWERWEEGRGEGGGNAGEGGGSRSIYISCLLGVQCTD